MLQLLGLPICWGLCFAPTLPGLTKDGKTWTAPDCTGAMKFNRMCTVKEFLVFLHGQGCIPLVQGLSASFVLKHILDTSAPGKFELTQADPDVALFAFGCSAHAPKYKHNMHVHTVTRKPYFRQCNNSMAHQSHHIVNGVCICVHKCHQQATFSIMQ